MEWSRLLPYASECVDAGWECSNWFRRRTEQVFVACEEVPCDIILLTNMEIIFIHFQVRLLWLKVRIKHTDLSSWVILGGFYSSWILQKCRYLLQVLMWVLFTLCCPWDKAWRLPDPVAMRNNFYSSMAIFSAPIICIFQTITSFFSNRQFDFHLLYF